MRKLFPDSACGHMSGCVFRSLFRTVRNTSTDRPRQASGHHREVASPVSGAVRLTAAAAVSLLPLPEPLEDALSLLPLSEPPEDVLSLLPPSEPPEDAPSVLPASPFWSSFVSAFFAAMA